MASLRDFLLPVLVVHRGTPLDLRMLGDEIGAALRCSILVRVGNALIVMAIMRTGFLAGPTGASIREFSIPLMAVAVAVGRVDQAELGGGDADWTGYPHAWHRHHPRRPVAFHLV